MAQCTALTLKKTQCKRSGTGHPPLCPIHSKTAKVGAPPGNLNAEKHGYYTHTTAPERIADLIAKRNRLSVYIDKLAQDDNTDATTFADLLEKLSRLDQRIQRLEQQQHPGDTTIQDDIEQALDIVWKHLDP